MSSLVMTGPAFIMIILSALAGLDSDNISAMRVYRMKALALIAGYSKEG